MILEDTQGLPGQERKVKKSQPPSESREMLSAWAKGHTVQIVQACRRCGWGCSGGFSGSLGWLLWPEGSLWGGGQGAGLLWRALGGERVGMRPGWAEGSLTCHAGPWKPLMTPESSEGGPSLQHCPSLVRRQGKSLHVGLLGREGMALGEEVSCLWINKIMHHRIGPANGLLPQSDFTVPKGFIRCYN